MAWCCPWMVAFCRPDVSLEFQIRNNNHEQTSCIGHRRCQWHGLGDGDSKYCWLTRCHATYNLHALSTPSMCTRATLRRRSTRARRGETTRRILEVLAAESGNGIAVAEIAARIGTHCRNVHVWLSSTGKKNPLIVRSGRGVYQMLKTLPAAGTE